MPIDATVGGASSNSYATLLEATAYQSTRTFATAWLDLDEDVQIASLIEACRTINATFVWTGSAADDVQVLSWPRIGMYTRNGFAISSTSIPQELKDAQSELARLLTVDDLTTNLPQDQDGLVSVKAGPVAVKFRDSTTALSLSLLDANLRLSNPEFAFLDKTTIPPYVALLLVPSWYTRAAILRRPIFQAYR